MEMLNKHILCLLLLFAGMFFSCGDNDDEMSIIEYDIPKGCVLDIESDKVTVIDDAATFDAVFANQTVRTVDFECYSLLVAKGISSNGIEDISSKAEKDDKGTVNVNVYVQTNITYQVCTWYVAYLVKKPCPQKALLNVVYSPK